MTPSVLIIPADMAKDCEQAEAEYIYNWSATRGEGVK